MSDDSDIDVNQPRKRKRKTGRISDCSSSGEGLSPSARSRKHRARHYNIESSSESDSSIEIARTARVGRVMSSEESTSDSSDSDSSLELGRARRVGHVRLPSDRSDSEDWSTESESSNGAAAPSRRSTGVTAAGGSPTTASGKCTKASSCVGRCCNAGGSSSDSDGNTDKCPICLASFRTQEVGSPEACDHSFCAECIQEWAKNMNTCPVDRQPFNAILVRNHLNGKVLRLIPVEPPTAAGGAPGNDITPPLAAADATYCEVCGAADREDRMLLCDGCDLGYHLECLQPPLAEVPYDAWYCSTCSRPTATMATTAAATQTVDIAAVGAGLSAYDISVFVEFGEGTNQGRTSTRLVPRTQQSERVRTRIMSLRQQQQQSTTAGPSNSSITTTTRTTTRTKKKSKKRKRRTSRKLQIKYEIDEATGQKIKIQARYRVRKRRRRTRRKVRVAKPKTVKKRLAVQLGMCKSRNNVSQALPDIKVSHSANSIGMQRTQAGIPTLHLFGQRDVLDYFSGSDSEPEDAGYGNTLVRRRPNHSDAAIMRRAARRKAVTLPRSVNTTSSSDLLGSILESQSQFHARNTVLSLNQDGTLKVDKTSSKYDANSNRINVNDNRNHRVRQTPLYSNHAALTSTSPTGSSSSGAYRQIPPHSTSSGNMNAVSTSSNAAAGDLGNSSSTGGNDQDTPQDYSLHPSCSTADTEDSEKKDNSDSELDIYSDIETVSTSRATDGADKPETTESPLPVLTQESAASSGQVLSSHNGTDDDDVNSDDADLIIDTEKLVDEKVEESTAVVTSSVDSAGNVSSSITTSGSVRKVEERESTPHSTCDVQSHQVQSTANNDEEHDEDLDSEDDGCPNFNIYSAESMDVAKTSENKVREEQNAIDEAKLQQAFPSSQEEEEQLMLDGHEDDMDDIDKTEKEDEEDEVPAAASNDLDDITSHDGDDRNNDSDEKNEDEVDTTEVTPTKKSTPKTIKPSSGGLYSDSDDEMVKIDTQPFGLADIRNMTEDISEEERSYTPCLDEKLPTSSSSFKERLEDDLEAISDEERNDFDESHEQKTASDGGDALEINAKESELDFTKPEDYEEGEIVDKSKKAEADDSKISSNDEEEDEGSTSPKVQNESKETVPDVEKTPEKVETTVDKEEVSTTEKESFKKLSKSNKERNYRDKDKKEKDKDRHHHHRDDDDDDDYNKDRKGNKNDRERDRDKENRRERKREKRKEIPRYNVRSLIADKPPVRKDRFGRDEERRRAHSRSRSSGGGSVSPTPQKRSSVSPRGGARRSYTPDKNNKKRLNKRSSRSKSYERKRSRTPRNRNKRDSSPAAARAGTAAAKRSRRSRSRGGGKPRNRSLTPPARHHRDWEQASAVPPRRRSSRAGWTPSISRSRSPQERRLTPSWTPPRNQQAPPVTVAATAAPVASVSVPAEEAVVQAPLANKPESLTVILMNDAGKKKKEKRKRAEKKKEEQRNATAARKRRRERGTPPPSKEVFASGDNILVSVSFNKETDGTSKRKRDDEVTTKRTRKEKEKHTSTAASKTAVVQTPAIVATSSIVKPRRKRKPQQDLSGVKPVAIIDLDRSPFKELTPSPKDVIVLSDSENGAESGGEQLQPDDGDVGNGDGAVVASILACDSSSQQVVSPAHSSGGESTYTIGGPKTPPEPQVKFSLSTKPQLRGMNPLHEDDDEEEEEDNELLANTTVADGSVGGAMVAHNGSGTMAPAEDIDPQEELEQRLNESLQLQQQQLLQLQQHKGPNTPPDPPNSAPSSPDAYDPFDPTKSRSPTPEPASKSVGGLPSPTKTVSQDDGKDSSGISGKGDDSSDLRKSHTPPVVADIQPADSQSNTSISNLTPSHPNTTTSSTPTIPPSSLLTTKPIPLSSSSAAITTVLNQIAAIAGNFPTTSVSSAKTIPSTSSSSSSATIITSTPSVASATSMATTSAVAAVASSLARINVLGGALLNPVGGGVALGSGMVKKKVVGKGVTGKGGRKTVGGQQGGGNGGNDTNVEFEQSPYSPGSSDYEDLFEPPAEQLGGSGSVAPKTSKKKASNAATQGNKSGGGNTGSTFDNLFGSLSPLTKSKQKSGGKFNRKSANSGKGTKLVGVKIDEDSLKVMDEVPNSAVEMQVKDKFLKKLNRQERVVEEVKLVLKPHYNKKHITKEEYKDVLRRAVPKICHNKSGEINPKKIQNLIEAYVKKLRQSKKVTSSSSKM